MTDVLFWVQHLLGIGHLTRAATLVRAMRARGLGVTLVSGGAPLPWLDLAGAELVQLPPVQSDGISFSQLLDLDGRPIDDGFKAARTAALLDTFHTRRPRLLLFEMFPFGRRQMRFELLPLIEAVRAATPRPLLVSSVRDILVEAPKPSRLEEMLTLVETAFDAVLVHGDPALVPFEQTFPHVARITKPVIETGYVVEAVLKDAGAPGAEGAGEIIVSTGGGRVGEQLLETAADAARMAPELPRWRLLAGAHVADDALDALRARAGAGCVVERARPDFRALLGRCTLSISQGGYNTVMEVLAAGCRAVVVPYAARLETEQTLRCRLLAERGLLTMIEQTRLDALSLFAAVQHALMVAPPVGRRPALDGTVQTVNILERLLHGDKQR